MIRRFFLLAGILSLLMPLHSWAVCLDPGNHLTVLRWSKDGHNALMVGYFPDRTDFFVVEGKSKQIYTFPFSVMGKLPPKGGKKVFVPDGVTPQQCDASMNKLNALLAKDQIDTVPLQTKPCSRGGVRSLTTADLGPQQNIPQRMVSMDQRSGAYESELVSPSKKLKFNLSGNLICGGDHVIAFRKQGWKYKEFHRW